uniref:Si:ch1073-224n8.1 n=1 Tax=Echeneis naucrates TaxID=173247 RepID=A0A665U2W6_ECHNA
MTSRRTGYAGSMDSSPADSGSSSVHTGNRKQSIINITDRTGSESCYDRKADKAGYGASQGTMTVTSLKSRLAPTIQTAMSAAVDTLLGEVVLGPVSGSGQPSRKESGLRTDSRGGDGERSSHNVGDLSYGQVGEGGSQRSFTHPLRHQRPVRECSSALQQGGLDGQKALTRTSATGRGDGLSPGRTEDSAGPSVPDTAGEPSGDRPHHCLECGKTFRLISSLKKHIRIHTGEKPYPCGVCGRRFRESGALKTHLRIHTGEKPYSCSECGNCFRHLDGLRKHRRTHTGEKPYVCAICGKRLSRLQHLKHHQLIHTGERPCCCPFCNRSFKEPAALRKHIRTHREEGGHMGIAANDDTDPDISPP